MRGFDKRVGAYEEALSPALPKLGSYLNAANNIAVEFSQIFRGNPVFGMNRATDLLHAETAQIFSANCELGDKPRAALLDVPIPRDLDRICLIRDWIEDRLAGKSRRDGRSPHMGGRRERPAAPTGLTPGFSFCRK